MSVISVVPESNRNASARRQLDDVQRAVQPHIDAIARHPVFHRLTSILALRVFMEHHVFAVWDFMSLLKALQQAATCIAIPWVPCGDPAVRRFINELVLDEESDKVSLDGAPPAAMSHFELYLKAMERVGADTRGIQEFLIRVRGGNRIGVALTEAPVPDAARQFVLTTMEVVNMNRVHAIAAAFTFGREQAIPAMFLPIVEALDDADDRTATLITYLKRHIEMDGDDHGPLSLQLLAGLCGDDCQHWNESSSAAIAALQARKRLWDGVLAVLPQEA
jgi:hypothetical protein